MEQEDDAEGETQYAGEGLRLKSETAAEFPTDGGSSDEEEHDPGLPWVLAGNDVALR